MLFIKKEETYEYIGRPNWKRHREVRRCEEKKELLKLIDERGKQM